MPKSKRKIKKSTLKKKLWKQFSIFIRNRDDKRCFTCSARKDDIKEMDAGHYIPTSICGEYLYFDERNVHCQCRACNRFKGGNLTNYARNLVRMFGAEILEEFDKIKSEHKTMPYSEMEELLEKYKELNKKIN